MKKKAVIPLSIIALAILTFVSACSPVIPTPAGTPTVTDTAGPTQVTSSPQPTATPTPIEQPELTDDEVLVPALPPFMIAVDESISMNDKKDPNGVCDPSKLRYNIPRFLIDVFSDLETQKMIQPSSFSLYFLANGIKKGGDKTGTFFDAKRDRNNWGLLTKSVEDKGYNPQLFDDMFIEYLSRVDNANKNNAPEPELLLITDGDFRGHQDEAVNTRKLLGNLQNNAKVYVMLVCPKKYENSYPGVEDYWFQRANESNGKIVTLGTDGLKDAMKKLISGLFSTVGWPEQANDGIATTPKSWGVLDDNGKTTISILANSLHLRTAPKYIYLLGHNNFDLPQLDFDGPPYNRIPKNIYPVSEQCLPRSLDISKDNLGKDDFAFYWSYSEPIKFALEEKVEEKDTPTPIPTRYIYNNQDFDQPLLIHIENVEDGKAVNWKDLGNCYEVRLFINDKQVATDTLKQNGAQNFSVSFPGITLDPLKLELRIYRKNSEINNDWVWYQTLPVKTDIRMRYFPIIHAEQPSDSCETSNPNGATLTDCTVSFPTEFMKSEYYPSKVSWLPNIDGCGNTALPNKPDINTPLQAYLNSDSLSITLKDMKHNWSSPSCSTLIIHWVNILLDGWKNQASISCSFTWNESDSKRIQISCP